jgi:hypothetical protein
MTKKQDVPPKPRKRPVRDAGHADARGDFYYDELMTPQPDAIREFYRARELKKPEDKR